MGDTVDSLKPFNIAWDPTCLTNNNIDIYLISPNADYPRIHLWQNLARSRASYTATLMPRWWNATASQSLQISILPAGQPPFLSTFPAGPIFTATYTQPSSGAPASADTSQIDSGVTPVNDGAGTTHMTPGKKGAAVFFSLVLVLLCVGLYIKLKRTKGLEKRKAWTEAIDKRMSTISTDWKSVSGAGANAAIRTSMAIGNRNSSFSFGAIRPSSSTFAAEGDDASATTGKSMKQVRTGTGVGLRNPAALNSTERISRVSFAADTRPSRISTADSRPSVESRRTRAFHSAYIPPVPTLPDNTNDDDDASEDTSGSFSPRQTQGALTLTPEEIRSRVTTPAKTTGGSQEKSDISDYLPALSRKSPFFLKKKLVHRCLLLLSSDEQ